MSSSATLDRPVSKPRSAPRVTAETLAARQRDISVSEFFAKNRHLLGFDSPRKALLTAVKEAVDNSLDACEEAGILPEITVVIEDLQPDRFGGAGPHPGGTPAPREGRAASKASRYRVTVVDNGPGIVRQQVENVFGRLLFGSKFHRLKMSRGQQGIGISAAGMYGLITTGKPMLIQTRPKARRPAHHIELAMNTKTNRAEVTVDEETDDFPLRRLRELSPATREMAERGEFLSPEAYPTGTSVTIELEGKYQRGRGSVDEFLELTAIANPHARIVFVRPTRETAEEDEPSLLRGRTHAAQAGGDAAGANAGPTDPGPAPAAAVETHDLGGVVVFPRAVANLPPETREIQPHPRGVELGTLLQMLKDFEAAEKGGTLYNFLQQRFCRISAATAAEFCRTIGVTSRTRVADIEPPQAEALYKAFQESRLAPPPTDCLAPIGVQQLLKGMCKGVRAEFYAASSREPDVYRGRPFLVETAIAFGGELPAEEPARVIRFANRVPLLFQQSACSSFKAVTETSWRNYNLSQPKGSLPIGPLVIMIHMASVWVPFTSESKEAIADYDEIRREMRLALMECGRKLGTYLRRRQAMRRQSERRDIFERYIGEIARAVHQISGTDQRRLYDALLHQARRRTAIADQLLDDEGRVIKEDPAEQDGVLVVQRSTGPTGPGDSGARGSTGDRPPLPRSRADKAMLKVAAMAGSTDNEQPSLLEVSPAKRDRPSKRGKNRAGPADAPAGGPAGEKAGGAAGPGRRGGGAAVERSGPSAAAGPPKPRMRLVNGKMVPVDDGQTLF